MKTKFLVSFAIFIAVLAVMPVILAGDTLNISNVIVEVNRMDTSNAVAVETGEVVPVEIWFTAGENATDVEISAWIKGEDKVKESFKDLIEGKEYYKKLSVEITKDLDETEEQKTLYVRIETDEGTWEESFTLNVQRKPYNAEILFVEASSKVEAGSSVAVDIVVKNLGRHEFDDLIVKVSVPELGISKRAYLGDLTPTDDEDLYGEDAEDAAEGRVYLQIPTNAKTGTYELVVEAYNSDSKTTVTKNIEVTGAEEASKVLVPVTSKEMGAGETKTYDLVIVNSGNSIGIYEIIPGIAEGVLVNVQEPIVTVPAGSSRVVKIEVKAGSRDGAYNFVVDVNSEGKLVDKVVMNANVVKTLAVSRSNLTILTVVLAIIFVVLLIVLLVLLTRKPKAEELEESYY